MFLVSMLKNGYSSIQSNLFIYTVWISTQILTSTQNRHIDHLFSDLDKHTTLILLFIIGYDNLQAYQSNF